MIMGVTESLYLIIAILQRGEERGGNTFFSIRNCILSAEPSLLVLSVRDVITEARHDMISGREEAAVWPELGSVLCCKAQTDNVNISCSCPATNLGKINMSTTQQVSKYQILSAKECS